AGFVGIGTGVPISRLHIYNATAGDAFAAMGDGIATAGECHMNFGYGGASLGPGAAFFNVRPCVSATGENPSLAFATKNITVITINKDQNVGIGITSPTRKLDVTGTVGLSSSITDATGTPGSICYDTSTFEMTKNNALTCTVSDAREKKDIYSLSGLQISGLNLIDKMKPAEFSMLKEPDNRRRWGFIAQDLREADKRLADGYGPNYSDDGSLTIDQTAILAVAVKAIQEQSQLITKLENRLKILETIR
ncbi:MAG: tail fiber domain-containing protein, partial [Burkholderiales bacterium]